MTSIVKSAHQDVLRLKPYNRQKYGMKTPKPVSNIKAEKHSKAVTEKYGSMIV